MFNISCNKKIIISQKIWLKFSSKQPCKKSMQNMKNKPNLKTNHLPFIMGTSSLYHVMVGAGCPFSILQKSVNFSSTSREIYSWCPSDQSSKMFENFLNFRKNSNKFGKFLNILGFSKILENFWVFKNLPNWLEFFLKFRKFVEFSKKWLRLRKTNLIFGIIKDADKIYYCTKN